MQVIHEAEENVQFRLRSRPAPMLHQKFLDKDDNLSNLKRSFLEVSNASIFFSKT
jgi:hypothetical protein